MEKLPSVHSAQFRSFSSVPLVEMYCPEGQVFHRLQLFQFSSEEKLPLVHSVQALLPLAEPFVDICVPGKQVSHTRQLSTES